VLGIISLLSALIAFNTPVREGFHIRQQPDLPDAMLQFQEQTHRLFDLGYDGGVGVASQAVECQPCSPAEALSRMLKNTHTRFALTPGDRPHYLWITFYPDSSTPRLPNFHLPDTPVDIDIPAGELHDSVNLLAKQYHISLLYGWNDVPPFRQVPELKGSFRLYDAFGRLLAGTGTHFEWLSPLNSVIVPTDTPVARQATPKLMPPRPPKSHITTEPTEIQCSCLEFSGLNISTPWCEDSEGLHYMPERCRKSDSL